MSLTPPDFEKAKRERIKKLEKKAKAYDDYLKQVDEGKIVVLVGKELYELTHLFDWSLGLANEKIIKFLEEHSNWRVKT